MRTFFWGVTLSAGLSLASLASLAAGAQDQAATVPGDNVMVVFDASNSMWGQIDGTAKIETAREVMKSLLGEWTENRHVGLMAYGHRRRGDCGDIETLVAPAANTRDAILKTVTAIKPRGKTPLTNAVERAARELSYADRPATVVLISDGLESCDRDPCALARALEEGGVSFTAHVVGFGLGADQDASSLACIAEETGGIFVQAGNAAELEAAMGSVSSAVAEAPPPEPAVEPAPEPQPAAEPEPALPEVAVTDPGTAVGGSVIALSWEPTLGPADYLTVVAAGTPEGEFGPYVRAGVDGRAEIAIPGRAGPYEIRYVHAESNRTLGRAPLRITEPQVALSGPDLVLAGAEFTVGWAPTINPRDHVTIVPVGAPRDSFGSYLTVRDRSEGLLTAPAEPGAYELRYVLDVDGGIVARLSIEVAEPEVVLEAPQTALAGAEIPLRWTGAVNEGDYITIVPVGTPEGEYDNHFLVRDRREATLQAPPETGLYEIRYMLRAGDRTLARAAIEIVAPEVTVSAPATAAAGSRFPVSWTGTVHHNDYVTIVPAGAPEGEFGSYVVVRDKSDDMLQAPAEPGLYEIRYVLREGNRTLATAPVEITEAEVTISAPDRATAGARFEVSWGAAVNGNDYVTIVPAGTPEGEFGDYVVVRTATGKELQAPAEPGLYEVRYILREGNRTLARTAIEITPAQVSLTAPATALAGSEIPVSWSGTVSPGDYVGIVPAGAGEGEFGNYFAVRDRTERGLRAPARPGLYEIRYILRKAGKTLASVPIEITEPEVSISGPDAVRAGDGFTASWTGTVDGGDYVALVPLGSPDDEVSNYFSVRGQSRRDIKAPESPGMYELRYILREGPRVLARQPVEVLAEDAALNTGATLDAPQSASAGSTIEVGWSVAAAPGADQRIALATVDQPIFTWIKAVRIDGAPPIRLTLPDAPGSYELRFLDIDNQAVLARQVIEVSAD